MKIIHIAAIAALTSLVTTLMVLPRITNGESVVLQEPVTAAKETSLSPAQIIWLARLMQCESGIKSNAINPNDRDNTPSYGLLQFKPATFATAAKQYGIASSTEYMNPELQVLIVENWILRGEINWHQQFPACTVRLGLPPQ